MRFSACTCNTVGLFAPLALTRPVLNYIVAMLSLEVECYEKLSVASLILIQPWNVD